MTAVRSIFCVHSRDSPRSLRVALFCGPGRAAVSVPIVDGIESAVAHTFRARSVTGSVVARKAALRSLSANAAAAPAESKDAHDNGPLNVGSVWRGTLEA